MILPHEQEVYDLPKIESVSDCDKLFPDILIISDYNTYEKFDDLYYKVYYATCAAFGVPNCLSYPIRFKFYPDDEVTYQLSMPKFLLNINAWRPMVELCEVQDYYNAPIEELDESFIVDGLMSNKVRVGLESKVLKVLDEYGITFNRISELLKTVIERYQEASIEFAMTNKSAVMTFESLFLNDYMKSKKIQELNNLVVPQSLQTVEVEKLLHDKYEELTEELGRHKNPIWYMTKAGNHIKPKQVQELFISYGQIPDISGNVIPYTMQGNGFATGYSDPITYYIASIGARLSSIMNVAYMGKAGYFARNLWILSRTLRLSHTMNDCGTQHLLPLTVTNADFLRRLENRWYTETEGGVLKLLKYDECRHLIGKQIWIRSLLTCAGGDEVCHVCYGNDSHLVMDMPGMAIYNTEVYSEPVTQNILSTKHLLFTMANQISFSNSFMKYFNYNAADVYLKDYEDWNVDAPFEKLYIRIPYENVIPINQEYDSANYNSFGSNIESPFYVYNALDKSYEPIEIKNYESMFIDADSMGKFKVVHDRKQNKNYYEISMRDLSIELEGRLLNINIKNNGMTDVLLMIMELLDRKTSRYDDYAVLAQEFLDKLIDANIACRHVQAEIILNRLIRDAHDLYHRPDFRQFQMPDYKILTLNQALHNTDSPTIALSYQEVKRQILGNPLYDDKKNSSYMDYMFADKVDTSRLKEIINARRKEKEGK